MSDIKNIIAEGKAILGIEFGSTRIKAVLINPEDFKPVAQGAHEWENRLENGFWTYHLDDIWNGLQDCYQDIAINTILNTLARELDMLKAATALSPLTE